MDSPLLVARDSLDPKITKGRLIHGARSTDFRVDDLLFSVEEIIANSIESISRKIPMSPSFKIWLATGGLTPLLSISSGDVVCYE